MDVALDGAGPRSPSSWTVRAWRGMLDGATAILHCGSAAVGGAAVIAD